MKQALRLLLTAAAISFVCAGAWSQAIFSTITGIVTDTTGAVVPGAQVTFRNADSGDTRQTTTDQQGYYTFASVPVGTYNLTVNHAGFEAFQESGIGVGGGETKSFNVSLKVGNATETVDVSAIGDVLTPVDTGEKTITLSTQQLENYVQTGSNAAEYLKIMPGFGVSNGVSNESSYSGQTIGINASGNAGSQSPLSGAFAYNGLPGNTLDIVSDGAHVSDPGCNCDTPVNPNSDFLQEFRVLASDFSAEDQKGPMVVTSVTKAGGSQFHGSAFFTARNYHLNSNDAYNNFLGAARSPNVYYYPGVDIGGPVLLPHVGFNKDRSKLFFFAGFEYFYQALSDANAQTATVPTTAMINGNFSPASLAALGTKTASGGPPGTVPASWPNGQMPANLIDPSMQALMRLYPQPNANPNATGGFNYVQNILFNQNDTQFVVRGDYDISDNTKVWARYNWQTEVQPFPLSVWATYIDQVPYPTPVSGKNSSQSIAATVTHVFNSSLTSETVFAYTLVKFANVFSNPSKVNPSSVGYNDPTLFEHTTPTGQIPNFGGVAKTPSEAAIIINQGGFYVGGSNGLFAFKYLPSGSETLTKVWRTHTFAAGVFYEWIRNSQPDSNPSNGTSQFYPPQNPTFTYGDAYADMLSGNLSSYQEYNFNRLFEESYWTLEGFAQDSWKVKPRLTLNYGLRFTHFEPWIDDVGFGFAVFKPSQYSSANNGACAIGPTFCGFSWHSRDPSVPLGGFPTRSLFYQPRVGVAYDFHGNGSLVLRGGWGLFYYHLSQFTAGLDTSSGETGVTLTPSTIGPNSSTPARLLASRLNTASFAAVPATPEAVSDTDDKQPYTEDYNVTLEQRTPWSGLLSLAYVGNVSRDLPSVGGYGSNLNLVPLGAMLGASNPGLANPNVYRPYLGYSQLDTIVNNLYSNYNALQATWAHQSKTNTINLNYTWGKAMGIVGVGTNLASYGAELNPFNLRANYGIMPTSRSQLFSAAYTWNLPSPIKGNRFAGGALNGWELSGLTGLQSGANLTGNAGNYDFNLNLNGAVIPGSVSKANPAGIPINDQSILGTPDIGATPNATLTPYVTCNPKSNLAPHQFINPHCFAAPTIPGVGGPAVLPTFTGPAYFASDLGVFKNFQIGSRESQKLQLRVQAQNFLNHPLYSFPNTNNLTLNFTQATLGGPITLSPTSAADFGVTQNKQGNRIVEFSAKYFF
jgi:Carboxypeptidase regulatory-like domain